MSSVPASLVLPFSFSTAVAVFLGLLLAAFGLGAYLFGRRPVAALVRPPSGSGAAADPLLRLWAESFDRTRLGIAISDARSNCLLTVNAAFAEDRGFSREELVGMPLLRLFPAGDEPVLRGLVAELDTRGHALLEANHLRKDGASFPVLFDITELRDAEGKPAYRVAYALNLSERKRAQDALQAARDEARARADEAAVALREQGERLALFIEHAPAALAMFDRDMRYLAASRRWSEDFGLGREVLAGRSHYEVFPEIGEAWKAVHRRGLAGEVVRAEEDRFVRADGRVQWLRWEVRPWRDEAGGVGGILIFSEDISRYKEAEERQRRLVGMLRAVREINLLISRELDAESLLARSAGLLVEGRGYRSVWWALEAGREGRAAAGEAGLGPAFGSLRERLLRGDKPDCWRRALGSDDIVVIPSIGAECPACELKDAYADGAAFAGHLRHGGRDYGVLVVALPPALAADPEEQALFREVAGDIGLALYAIETEERRERTEKGLRESEARLRATFEQAAVGIALVGPDLAWLRVNQKLCEILGRPREPLLGRKMGEVLVPGGAAEVEALFRGLLSGGKAGRSLVSRCLRPEGTEATLQLTASPLWGGEGGEPRFILVVEDISARVLAEEAIAAALREKEALLRELYHRTKNNMLTIIAMMSLQRGMHPEASLETFVEDVSRRIETMALIHQKLYQRKELSRLDLGEYLGELATLSLESAGLEGRVGLTLDLASIPVLIDTAIPVGIVVNELLTNSLRHAFPGERRGEISLSLARGESGAIELRFRDDGVGFPEGSDPRELRSFGLVTAFTLVEEQLHGRLGSEGGKGTTYLLSFRDDRYEARV